MTIKAAKINAQTETVKQKPHRIAIPPSQQRTNNSPGPLLSPRMMIQHAQEHNWMNKDIAHYSFAVSRGCSRGCGGGVEEQGG